MLPDLIRRIDTAARTCPRENATSAETIRAQAYQAAAMVLNRVGETGLAWTAADRAVAAAEHAGSGAFGDAATAVETGEMLDLQRLPAGLAGRRSQVSLDLARGYAQQRHDAAALNMLLAAERAAPQLVRYDAVTHGVLALMLRREHRASTPQLRPLARRAGVI